MTIAILGLGLGLGSVARAQETRLTGETTKGVAVKLTVGYFGNATAFRVAEHDVKCNHGRLSQRARTYKKFVFSDPGSFLIRSRKSKREGALRLKNRTRVRGAIAADNQTWSGIYKSITRVFEDGERIDSCRVRSVWHVS